MPSPDEIFQGVARGLTGEEYNQAVEAFNRAVGDVQTGRTISGSYPGRFAEFYYKFRQYDRELYQGQLPEVQQSIQQQQSSQII